MFRRTKTDLPTKPVKYPSGVYVHTEKGYFFIKSADGRVRITSERVLASWAPPRIVETTEAAVANYRVTSKLRFRNGSLIYSIADGKMYYIEDGKRRLISSPEALTLIGADWNDAVTVSVDEINLHQEGAPLT